MVSDASAASLPDIHGPGPGIVSTSQLSAHFQSHSSSTPTYHPLLVSSLLLLDLLDQDFEMQRVMSGAVDSFDSASINSVHRTHNG